MHDAVRNVAHDLDDWSRNILGDLEKHIKHARGLLDPCRKRAVNDGSVQREELLTYKLEWLEE